MSKANHRRIGAVMEDMAADFVVSNGGRIIARNYHDGRKGEIDLIIEEKGVLAFAEVKYRGSLRCGAPEDSVTAEKQRTIRRAAEFYLYRERRISAADLSVRFDVISILRTGPSQVHVRWIRGAF
ncbi:MAG: YraN family protein [Lachnospiraceae bacterium]|nr:YraN family protein [Lachnospiraceae bacterium]